jgi:hypothetical protein
LLLKELTQTPKPAWITSYNSYLLAVGFRLLM